MALANNMIEKNRNQATERGGGTPVLPRLNNRNGTPSSQSRITMRKNHKAPQAARDAKERMQEMYRDSDRQKTPETYQFNNEKNIDSITIEKFRNLFESNREAFKGMSWDEILAYASNRNNPADVEKAMVMAAKMSEKIRDKSDNIDDGIIRNKAAAVTLAIESKQKTKRIGTPHTGIDGQRQSQTIATVSTVRKSRPVTPLIRSQSNQSENFENIQPHDTDILKRGHTSPQQRSKNMRAGPFSRSDESDGDSMEDKQSESSYDTEEEIYRREEARRRERRRRRRIEKERQRREHQKKMKKTKRKSKKREKRGTHANEQAALPAGLMGLGQTSPEKGHSHYGGDILGEEAFSPHHKSPVRGEIPIKSMRGERLVDSERQKQGKLKLPSKLKSHSEKFRSTGVLNHETRQKRLRPNYLRR